MKLTPFEDFADICELQDVTLDERIHMAASFRECSDFGTQTHTPTAMLAAIAEAGNMLRLNPDAKLATARLDLSDIDASDICLTTLGNMVNGSLRPVPPAPGSAYFVCRGASKINTCQVAEEKFAQAIAGAVIPESNPASFGYQVFMNGTGPVFMRKSDNIPSALALDRFVVNGVPYPAGSLVRIDAIADKRAAQVDDGFIPELPADEVRTIPITAITKIAFARLSAYAVRPECRWQFGEVKDGSDDVRTIAETWTPADIRQALPLSRNIAYDNS